MEATDEDIGVNANITYSLSPLANGGGLFAINSETGVLYTTASITEVSKNIIYFINY